MSETIIKREADQLVDEAITNYAEKVILDRVVPLIDGCKPIHRRLIWSASQAKLVYKGKFKKSTTLVSETLKVHPHGDSSVYGALVRLSQPWKQNAPLLAFQGNSGSIHDSNSFAAYRYTYSKLSEFGMQMLDGISKNAVDINVSENDSEFTEPVVLPSKFPNLLVNGSVGIGFGLSANFLPHNIDRVVDTIDAYIKNPEISEGELFNLLGGPSFPSGKCIIMNGSELEQVYASGMGRVVMRGDYTVQKNIITFNSLPYNVDVSSVLESLESLGEKGELGDVVEFRNETNEKEIRLVFELEKSSNPQNTISKLLAKTPLKSTFAVSQYVLINGSPKLLSLKGIVSEYVKHLVSCLIRESKFDLNKLEEELHINEGYLTILSDIDKAIELIKKSRDKVEAKLSLMDYFNLTERQANKILEMRLSRLTGLEIDKVKELIAELTEKVLDIKDLLTNSVRQGETISKNLSLHRNGRELETEINEEINSENETSIPKEEVILAMTQNREIFYCSKEVKKSQLPKNIKKTQKTDTHSKIGIVLEDGKFVKMNVSELPCLDEGSSKALLVPEMIEFFTNDTTHVSLCTVKGVVKNIETSEFFEKKRVSVFNKFKKGDSLVEVANTSGTCMVLMESSTRIFVDEQSDKTAVGKVFCGETPVSLCDACEEIIFITDAGRVRKGSVERNIVKNKSKGLVFSSKLNKDENIVSVKSDEPVIVNGKIVFADELSNRFRKV